MCAIFGAIIWDASPQGVDAANAVMNHIVGCSVERGRDGQGWATIELHRGVQALDPELKSHRSPLRISKWNEQAKFFSGSSIASTLIGNMRAEPTTEYVEAKHEYDQQPYKFGPWTIVHNGTIANDKELREFAADESAPNGQFLPTSIDSAAIVELLASKPTEGMTPSDIAQYFAERMTLLKGSYAILATHDEHPGLVLTACNYRPIWFAASTNGVFFASSRSYFPDFLVPQMIEPYSMWAFAPGIRSRIDPVCYPPVADRRALVVCSGGLDSVVAAAWAKAEGYDVSLLHFRYGSRAEGPEDKAIWAVAEALKVGVWTRDMYIYEDTDSPLLQNDSAIAGGEEGAEFAHEWVPARNLMMLAYATAMAEAKGFDTLILGNNLEEAGAYPDNEPEFIQRFNDMLPFAVGDGKRVRVVMPVGNLMKHEIVALGHKLGAPLHLTWSCYRAGEKHCGTCGPCYMRRTAFEINGLPEVIEYEG